MGNEEAQGTKIVQLRERITDLELESKAVADATRKLERQRDKDIALAESYVVDDFMEKGDDLAEVEGSL